MEKTDGWVGVTEEGDTGEWVETGEGPETTNDCPGHHTHKCSSISTTCSSYN